MPEAWPEPRIQWRFNGQLIDLNDLGQNNNRLLTPLPDGSAKYAVQRIASSGGQHLPAARSLDGSGDGNSAVALNDQEGFNGAEMLMTTSGDASVGERRQVAGNLSQNNNNNNNNANANDQLVDLFGSRLVIKQVDKMDEGSYSCVVETKGSHRLIERESPSARLIVSGKYCRSLGPSTLIQIDLV